MNKFVRVGLDIAFTLFKEWWGKKKAKETVKEAENVDKTPEKVV